MVSQKVLINAELIDVIPNDAKIQEKAFRIAGSSNAVTIPAHWQFLLNLRECNVEKALLKVRIPYTKVGKLELTYIENHVLLIAPEGFPFHLLEEKGSEN